MLGFARVRSGGETARKYRRAQSTPSSRARAHVAAPVLCPARPDPADVRRMLSCGGRRKKLTSGSSQHSTTAKTHPSEDVDLANERIPLPDCVYGRELDNFNRLGHHGLFLLLSVGKRPHPSLQRYLTLLAVSICPLRGLSVWRLVARRLQRIEASLINSAVRRAAGEARHAGRLSRACE